MTTPVQVDAAVAARGRSLRHRRTAGLLVGLGMSSASLVAWLFIPNGRYLGSQHFDPYDYLAAWLSSAFALVGVVAVVIGVVSALQATSFERDHPELEGRTRLLDVFFPLLVTALAIGVQCGIAGNRSEVDSQSLKALGAPAVVLEVGLTD